mgnify:CR=1 FL=1
MKDINPYAFRDKCQAVLAAAGIVFILLAVWRF